MKLERPEKKRRRKYQAPRVVTERLYERYGLACSKNELPACTHGFAS